jgi:hypothetical protein
MSHASPVITCSTLVNILTLITHLSTSHICTTLKSYVGLARTVYEHGIWPNIWWFSCQKYRIYSYKYVGLARTIYIYGLCTVLWQGNTRIYGAYLQILPTLHIYIVLANSIHTFSTWIMCLCNNAPLPWPHDTAGEPQWFDGKKDAVYIWFWPTLFIRSPRGSCVSVITRLCLDHMILQASRNGLMARKMPWSRTSATTWAFWRLYTPELIYKPQQQLQATGVCDCIWCGLVVCLV